MYTAGLRHKEGVARLWVSSTPLSSAQNAWLETSRLDEHGVRSNNHHSSIPSNIASPGMLKLSPEMCSTVSNHGHLRLGGQLLICQSQLKQMGLRHARPINTQ